MELPRKPIAHLIDNSAMPALTENVGVSKKTEHFARWMHYLRYLVQHGLIYVYLIRTYEMIADCLTKVPPKDLFARFMTIFYGTAHGYKSARQTF